MSRPPRNQEATDRALPKHSRPVQYQMIPCPCPRHPSPYQGYMSHGNTTAGLDLVSKRTVVIPFDLCHVGYREVPSICISAPGQNLANINMLQIPVKYITNGVQLKGNGYAE